MQGGSELLYAGGVECLLDHRKQLALLKAHVIVQAGAKVAELDLERDVPATADALRQASLRSEAERARLAERRAEARRDAQTSAPEG